MKKNKMDRFKEKITCCHPPFSNQKLTGEKLANRQLKKFGVNMLVLAASIGLYYLGFFGSVDGPLHPARLGHGLHSLGFTRTHLLFIFIGFLTLSVIWNWIYNLFNRWRGRGFTCVDEDESGRPCGHGVIRQQNHDQAGSENKWIFHCPKGHLHTTARFQPVQKGIWGHALWAAMLVGVCGMAIFIIWS